MLACGALAVTACSADCDGVPCTSTVDVQFSTTVTDSVMVCADGWCVAVSASDITAAQARIVQGGGDVSPSAPPVVGAVRPLPGQVAAGNGTVALGLDDHPTRISVTVGTRPPATLELPRRPRTALNPTCTTGCTEDQLVFDTGSGSLRR